MIRGFEPLTARVQNWCSTRLNYITLCEGFKDNPQPFRDRSHSRVRKDPVQFSRSDNLAQPLLSSRDIRFPFPYRNNCKQVANLYTATRQVGTLCWAFKFLSFQNVRWWCGSPHLHGFNVSIPTFKIFWGWGFAPHIAFVLGRLSPHLPSHFRAVLQYVYYYYPLDRLTFLSSL